ncbi:hypothetical protein XSP_002272 [Xanthomonas euroxanthea]|uniref:Uncharacterized protein n=1 Tax=Xanthomonas euroxanthea TaxID=2259622 RepID=A0A8E4EQE6_9XANT|nr:hypothetical protein [Xanthomonas euroxanthea]CAD1792358.1 hypothetical protein XSP_002272 [Xanthomonas euroxanthea]SYZ55697.1 hypothetical protein CPBF367_28770 [Xanthomonas arboricola pv. juglandis]
MKTLVKIASIFLGMSLLASAYGQEVIAIDRVPQSAIGTDAASMAVPVGVQLAEIKRLYNNSNKDHFSYFNLPKDWGKKGWMVEGSLGFVSSTYFENSKGLFLCWMASRDTKWVNKDFTSTDAGCEGYRQRTDGTGNPNSLGSFLGYVSAIQLPGTVPLYRCYVQAEFDHFDTLSSNCEGRAMAVNDGILGYIFL